MNILLLSDTHGEVQKTRDIIAQHHTMEYFVHLGDIGFPLHELSQFIIVKGNHDTQKVLPLVKILKIEERTILCLHGNTFDEETIQEVLLKKDIHEENLLAECMNILYGKLADYAISKDCDTVFFGHSHVACFCECKGVVLINPGSLSFGMEGSTYATVTIEKKQIKAIIHTC